MSTATGVHSKIREKCWWAVSNQPNDQKNFKQFDRYNARTCCFDHRSHVSCTFERNDLIRSIETILILACHFDELNHFFANFLVIGSILWYLWRLFNPFLFANLPFLLNCPSAYSFDFFFSWKYWQTYWIIFMPFEPFKTLRWSFPSMCLR